MIFSSNISETPSCQASYVEETTPYYDRNVKTLSDLQHKSSFMPYCRTGFDSDGLNIVKIARKIIAVIRWPDCN